MANFFPHPAVLRGYNHDHIRCQGSDPGQLHTRQETNLLSNSEMANSSESPVQSKSHLHISRKQMLGGGAWVPIGCLPQVFLSS